MTLLNILIPILVALISVSGTYFAVRRKNSGRVDTTEAGVLWQEATAIRRELRDDNADKARRIDFLEKELSEANNKITGLQDRVATLEKGV
jgi:hypothetical protein